MIQVEESTLERLLAAGDSLDHKLGGSPGIDMMRAGAREAWRQARDEVEKKMREQRSS